MVHQFDAHKHDHDQYNYHHHDDHCVTLRGSVSVPVVGRAQRMVHRIFRMRR